MLLDICSQTNSHTEVTFLHAHIHTKLQPNRAILARFLLQINERLKTLIHFWVKEEGEREIYREEKKGWSDRERKEKVKETRLYEGRRMKERNRGRN